MRESILGGFGPVVADFATAPLPSTPGVLIVNPEYGIRLGQEELLQPTYKRLGNYFKERCADWTCFVFSGNRYLTGNLGLKASQRTPFFNADIECRLLRYEMWKGKGAKLR